MRCEVVHKGKTMTVVLYPEHKSEWQMLTIIEEAKSASVRHNISSYWPENNQYLCIDVPVPGVEHDPY